MCIRDRYQRRVHGNNVMEQLAIESIEGNSSLQCDFESQFLQISSEIDEILNEVLVDLPTAIHIKSAKRCSLGSPPKFPKQDIPHFIEQKKDTPDTPHFNDFSENTIQHSLKNTLSGELPVQSISERKNSTPRFGSCVDTETECSETEMQPRHSLPSSFTDYAMRRVPKCRKHENKCQICSNLIACIILIPCGHSGVCEACSENLKLCPFCGCKIKSQIKINRPLAQNFCYYFFFSKISCLIIDSCLLYTSPSPRDLSTSRMPSSA
eukprot:TRINITY_DN4562_c0_g1_i3.p1 TRINITY_DN4562_c0_g1~~TRINITY_DN4562_c0_g1_i3.p1  ORF type:complete len:266 (-),score=29.18 TRINITY_DN4562_c0_g1_i3:80-877(-)